MFPNRVIPLAWALLVSVCAADAQDESTAPATVRQSSRPLMMRHYQIGEWGTQQVELRNDGDRPAEVVTGGYFGGAPLLQYGRQVTLPPHSIRKINFPILPTATEEGQIEWHALLYEVEGPEKTLLRASDAYVIEAENLPVAAEPISVLVSDHGSSDERTLQEIRNLATATRLALKLSTAVGNLTPDDLPPQRFALDAVDHVILASNRLMECPLRTAGLRRWIQQGGKLWVLLDLVEPATVERLFVDSIRLTRVDRTGLTQLQLHSRITGERSGEPLEFDYPAEFVRVLAENVEVIHEAGGWPASFSARLGDGRVMFTTLDARAWYHEDQLSPRQPLVELVNRWMRPLPETPVSPQAFETLLSQQTGYQIPTRRTVLSILFGFCVLLGAAGFLLQRGRGPRNTSETGVGQSGRRLERLAVIGPMLAGLAAAVLIGLGMQARDAAPAAAAVAEFVEVTAGGFETRSAGAAVICVPDPVAVDLTMSDSRLMIPAEDRLEGTLRQLIWTDARSARWEDFRIRPGLQFFETHQLQLQEEPIRALVTLGPGGIEGTLSSGGFSDPQDLVLATPAHHAITLSVGGDGRFRGGPGDVVSPGGYIRAALLSDEQSRRNAIFGRLLDSESEFRYPDRPTLLAWVRPSSVDVVFPEGLSEQHASLLAVPVEFNRTPPDTDVLIPSPLLPFTAVAGASGASAAWDARSARWERRAYGGRTLLRFDLPDSVTPLEIRSGRLQFKITAPKRSVELSAGNANELREIAVLEDPAGSFEYALDLSALPPIDAEEGFFVEVNVSELTAPLSGEVTEVAEDRSWKMDYLQLELSGRTAPAAGDEVTQ